MGKKCIVCGNDSKGKEFCYDCWFKKTHGMLDKCEICGEWNDWTYICECNQNKLFLYALQQGKNCLLCNEPSDSYHFCRDCYQKVRNGADLRIAPGGTEAKIIDPYGNKEWEADNGVTVRSKGEMIILNCLWKKHVRAIYEKPVMIGGETFRPDFYLPDQDLYIEYNGLDDPDYIKRKEETLKKYKKKGLNVVVLTDDEIKKINQIVDFILEKYK